VCSEIDLRIPARADHLASRRSEETAALTILSEITLRWDSPEVEVNVSFDNRMEDHRLRVLFPTGLGEAARVDAGAHFWVERRPMRIRRVQDDLYYEDMQTQPHQQFIDATDGARGLAFINDCLTEYEALNDPERTVSLTLLRAVKNEICAEYRTVSEFPRQKGGQCLGPHRFRYAVAPHAGDWRAAGLARRAERFNAPALMVQTTAHMGDLPREMSFCALDSADLRLSALKPAADRPTVIARIYNPTPAPADGTLRFFRPLRSAWRTNLNEDRIAPLDLNANGDLKLHGPVGGIWTVELEF
jgi:mannosylglycerate hydrolase